ncbi:MAG: hypothetical protein VX252_13510 [Myxococcota bacterium]|nr:hypothetical protein [Myxococcota bacterium]
MRHRILRHADSQDAFTDVLFNVLLGFAFLFILSIVLIEDSEDEGKVSPKAEMLITVRWPDRHPDDVDTLVEGPSGEVLWYNNRDAGLMHLDRDDRGRLADQIVLDGERISNPLNQETVTLRALRPGEYVVNLLHFKANYAESLPVTVKVEKLNPEVSLIYYGTRNLTGAGDEQTALRFTIGPDGEVEGTNELPKSLLTRMAGEKS